MFMEYLQSEIRREKCNSIRNLQSKRTKVQTLTNTENKAKRQKISSSLSLVTLAINELTL